MTMRKTKKMNLKFEARINGLSVFAAESLFKVEQRMTQLGYAPDGYAVEELR